MELLKDFVASKEGKTALAVTLILLAAAFVIRLLMPHKVEVFVNNGNDCEFIMPKNGING